MAVRAVSASSPVKGECRSGVNESASDLLVRSVGENCLKGVQEALNAKADPDTSIEGRDNVIHLACNGEVGNVAIVRELLRFRADPNARTYWGDAPLHRACLRGHNAIVKELIREKADIEARDSDAHSPLQRAIIWGRLDCCKTLIEARAAINFRSLWTRKTTPLILACEGGDSVTKVSDETQCAIVNLLLDAKADPNLDDTRSTPLMAAACRPKVLRILLDRGAEVSDEIPQGSEEALPLHTAARSGCSESVQILLEARANPHAKSAHGTIALTAAIAQRDLQLASPSNPPEVTAKVIADLEAVIALLQPYGSNKCMGQWIE